MTIRTRLAVRFMLLASFILGGAFMVVYYLSADYREEEFRGRLKDRGTNTAKLLIQVDEVDTLLLWKIEHDNPVRLPEESIRIYDHHNKLLFTLGEDDMFAIAPSFLDSVRLEGEIDRTFNDREETGFVFRDRYDRFVVVASARDIYGRSKLKNEGRVMLGTFLLAQILIFLIGRFYAQRALAPVQRLVHELQDIGAADLSRRVEPGDARDELGQLARSFNELLDRLQTAFQTQKHFIANASHEMRTPLTAISGQLDVILLRERSPEEYARAIRSVQEDMHALNQLADRLLLMAQAENKVTASSFTAVRVDEVLWSARSEVLRTAPGYAVEVDLLDVEDADELVCKGNENLLRSMFGNLIENACKYSDDHRALVRLRVSGKHIAVEVEDKGIGIAPGDMERVFEPFFRANNTGGAKGHGIGLSLARRIAELHGGRITLVSCPGEGSCFTAHLSRT